MDFIEAVLAISKRTELEICPNEDERKGKHDVCVHRRIGDLNSEFIGKLRWPHGNDTIAYVDDALIDYLSTAE